MEDGGDDVAGDDGALGGEAADGVALPHDSAPLDAAAGEGAGEAAGPVIAAAGGVDLGGAAKLGERGDERVAEEPAVVEVFHEGGVGLVVHRADDVLHPFDRGEGLGAVDVPGDLVEDGEEGVDGDEPDARFDEAAGEEAALPEAIHPVAFADGGRLLGEVKGGAGLGAGHHPVGGLEGVVEEAGVFAGLELPHGGFDDVAHLPAAVEAGDADLVGREEVGDLEIGLGGIGHEGERVVGFAEEATGLTVGEIAAAAAHELGENDERREVGAAAEEVRGDGAGVGGIDPAGEAAAGLHHLPAGVVDGGPVVVAGADKGELVGDGGMAGEEFGDFEGVGLRADRLEGAADLGCRFRLHVPEVEVARGPEVEDHDAGAFFMAGANLPFRGGAGELWQGEADAREGADMEKIAPGGAVAEVCPVRDAKLEHRECLPGVVGVAGEPA